MFGHLSTDKDEQYTQMLHSHRSDHRRLVSWCFEPSQPQRITSGLNTNFPLSPSHSFHKSSYHKSCCCFFSLVIFRGHSTGEPASGRVTYFILRTYTGTGVSHSQRKKTKQNKIRRDFGKNARERTGRVEISKEEIAISKCSMNGYILAHTRLERKNV